MVLLVAFAALLASTPTWFPHYAGVWAGVLAVTLGAAASVPLRSAGQTRLRRLAVAGVGAVGLAGAALQLTQVEFGSVSLAGGWLPLSHLCRMHHRR